MIILYCLAILVAVLPLVPENIVPFVVKWPIIFVVLISLTALFNLKKRDSIYITETTNDNNLTKRGLFHPLNTYAAASSFFVGFMMMETALLKVNLSDVILDLPKFFSLHNSERNLEMLIGMVFVIFAVVLAFSKWLLSRHADSATLRGRSIYYIALTLYVCFAYGILAWKGLYLHVEETQLDYLLNGYNIYYFYGAVGVFIIFDLIMTICRNHHYKVLREENPISKEEKQRIKESEKALRLEAQKDAEFNDYNERQNQMLEEELRRQEKEEAKANKLALKEAKKNKKKDVVEEAPVVEEKVEETPVEEKAEETPVEEPVEEKAEETPVVEETPVEETAEEEAPALEPNQEEVPTEEKPDEEVPVEENTEEAPKLSKKELKKLKKAEKKALKEAKKNK